MVDISDKETTRRTAVAAGEIRMQPATLRQIEAGEIEKGAVLQTARLAGIMAAKKTSDLIPLCHQLPLSKVEISFVVVKPDTVRICCLARTTYTTGVEMEALQGVSSAALTIYDMCKAVDKAMEISEIRLLKKTGGQSGDIRQESLPHYRGQVIAVALSEKKGTVKKPLPVIELEENLGVRDDAHAGDWHRQVSLLAEESISKMRNKAGSQAAMIGYGDFAENITTRGLELHNLPVGSRLFLGSKVLLEVTQIGKECHSGCAIAQTVGECIMPREGIFARVLEGGSVRPGMKILAEEVSNGENSDSHS